MITMHGFMFLSSFEKLREDLRSKTLVNMAHLGPRAFDEIGGEVVQTTSFVILNFNEPNFSGTYSRLVDGSCEAEKEKMFFSKNQIFHVKQENFLKIPGAPIVYWISDRLIRSFEVGKSLREIANPRVGLQTGENARFVRQWFEVDVNKTSFDSVSRSESVKSGKKWFPYNKGGEYRRWYGNNDYVVNWEHDGDEIRNFKDENGKLRSRPQNMEYYFQSSITWSKISSGSIAFRYKPVGHIFDVAGTSIFADETVRNYIHGFCNSNVALAIANAISPTLNYEVGHIASFPIIIDVTHKSKIEEIVEKNIAISKDEWDSYELSWDFKSNPLCSLGNTGLVSVAYVSYNKSLQKMFKAVKGNEVELNQLFICIYGLESEMSPDVTDSRVTIRLPDEQESIVNLISYAIGCMFGRYSLDREGLIYAGGKWNKTMYSKFKVDDDNIIPINDDEYFGDDIVTRLIEFIKIAFGSENLDRNLKFIGDNLGIKGSETSKEKIRKYFLNDFYKDHLMLYQKCPIYWLFDSGKENGFKALIYMHRYDENLIGKMRQNYLLPMQRRYIDQMEKETDQVKRSSLQKKIAEIERYDLAMELYSSNKVSIDLDDGVKVNYAKFQNIENSRSAKDKIDLLYRI